MSKSYTDYIVDDYDGREGEDDRYDDTEIEMSEISPTRTIVTTTTTSSSSSYVPMSTAIRESRSNMRRFPLSSGSSSSSFNVAGSEGSGEQINCATRAGLVLIALFAILVFFIVYYFVIRPAIS
jgi:hypothetical protein